MTKARYSLGLVGFPLSHSLSPNIHLAALRESGLEGEYRLYPIPPDKADHGQLEDLLNELRMGSIDGLNVTIPHKQSVVHLVDELTMPARETGAVNTIFRQVLNGRDLYNKDEVLVGDNTDVAGFMTDLHRHLPEEIASKAALVLGAGGAARAVVFALVQEGWQVVIAARRIEQAAQLIADFTGQDIAGAEGIEAMDLANKHNNKLQQWITDRGDRFTLLVNATPLGMWPEVHASPWPAAAPFPQQGLAYDLVYAPQETTWMREARLAGLMVAGGLGMLIEQAALAFERWTGLCASRESMALAATYSNHLIDKRTDEGDA